MDKSEFVDKAPQYYALGIVVALAQNNNKSGKTLADLDAIIESSSYKYFQKQPIVDHALGILVNAGAVEIIEDDFGPEIIKATGSLQKWWKETELPAFRKFAEVVSWDWLKTAIKSVNDTYDRLKVTNDDFSIAVVDSQWEPIPLDRKDEKLQKATAELDKAIKAIESDNGYAASVPGERNYVVSRLKEMSAALKEKAEVVWPEVKANAIDPLGRVIKRFGPAAVGVAALAARKAIVEWLKANWSRFLELLP
jgi:hypothetical protein